MSDSERGYRAAKADAEKVCAMLVEHWRGVAAEAHGERAKVGLLVADALALAGKAIRNLEPGFVSPVE